VPNETVLGLLPRVLPRLQRLRIPLPPAVVTPFLAQQAVDKLQHLAVGVVHLHGRHSLWELLVRCNQLRSFEFHSVAQPAGNARPLSVTTPFDGWPHMEVVRRTERGHNDLYQAGVQHLLAMLAEYAPDTCSFDIFRHGSILDSGDGADAAISFLQSQQVQGFVSQIKPCRVYVLTALQDKTAQQLATLWRSGLSLLPKLNVGFEKSNDDSPGRASSHLLRTLVGLNAVQQLYLENFSLDTMERCVTRRSFA